MTRTWDTSEGDYQIDVNPTLYAPDLRDGTIGAIKRESVTSCMPVITTDHAFIHEGIAFSLSTSLQFGSGKTGGIKFTTPKATKTAAAVTTSVAGDNNDVTFTAVLVDDLNGGTYGNGIDIIYADPSANDATLSADVDSLEITFNLATNGDGTITTTANDIIALCSSDEDVAALVTAVAKDGETGVGVVPAMAKVDLSGGLDGGYMHFKPVTFTANQPMTISLEEDTAYSDTGSAVASFNRNRTSDNTSTLSFLYDLDATLTTGAGAKTLDTFYLPAASTGANKVGSSAGAAEELVLKPSTNYLLKVVNSANVTDLNINLFWYEENGA